jgi:hypothetical protein
MKEPTVDDQNVWLALAIVALLCGVIEVVRSRAVSLLAWGLTAAALALCLAWWPN